MKQDENTEKLEISDLVFDRNNANRGTARGRGMLEKSLSKFGAGRSILLDKKNRIIAGNKTAATAGEIGLSKVRVVDSDGSEIIAVRRTDIDLESKAGRALAIADNRVAEVDLCWNAEELVSAKNDGVEIGEFFTVEELDALVDVEIGSGAGAGDGDESQVAQSEQVAELLKGLVLRPTWNKTRGVRFLSVRKWSEQGKKKTMDIFKGLKYACDDDLLAFVSAEMVDCLVNFIFPLHDIIVVAPPAGASAMKEGCRGHFATMLAERVARILGAEHQLLFKARPRKGGSSPHKYDSRGTLEFAEQPKEGAFYLLLDDVATSGTTIEEMANLIGKSNMVLSLAWVYENTEATNLSGMGDGVECAA